MRHLLAAPTGSKIIFGFLMRFGLPPLPDFFDFLSGEDSELDEEELLAPLEAALEEEESVEDGEGERFRFPFFCFGDFF